MAIEIEKKYRLDKRLSVDITSRLKSAGAEFTGDVFEENFLHRGGSLDERGAVLRVRKTGDTTMLTYKERFRSDSEIKHRIEYETEVADVDAVENIIKALGFTLSVVYEKHRRTWHFRDVEVVLDELPFGYYMEIEGTVEAIAETEKLLGFEELEAEPRGYPRLTVKYGRQIGEIFEARFDSTAKAV